MRKTIAILAVLPALFLAGCVEIPNLVTDVPSVPKFSEETAAPKPDFWWSHRDGDRPYEMIRFWVDKCNLGAKPVVCESKYHVDGEEEKSVWVELVETSDDSVQVRGSGSSYFDTVSMPYSAWVDLTDNGEGDE